MSLKTEAAYEDPSRLLESGERLLWSGRPRQGIVFRAVDIIPFPFSLFWLGIVALFGWFVLPQSGSISEAEGMLPALVLCGVFLLVGLYLLIGRHLADSIRRASTWYAVTDRRVIIGHNSWPRGVRSIDLQHLPSLRLDESSVNRGTIEFYDTASFAYGNRMGVWHPTIGQPPKLFEIDGAHGVFETIREAAVSSN